MKNIYGFFLVAICIFCNTDTVGQTNFWEKIDSPINGFSLAINPRDVIFLGTNYGVFRSTDNGTSWSHLDSNLDSNLIAYRFAFDSIGSIFFVFGYGGVFRSTDDGENWIKIYDHEPIKTIAINDNGHIFLGWGHETGGGVERSTDNGASWINTGLEANSYAIAINANGYVFSAGWYSSGGCIFLSTDNGASWTNTNIGLSSFNVVNTLEISHTGYIFAGTSEKGVYRSTDDGKNWIQVSPDIFVTSLAINSGGTIFTGTFDQGVYRSTDDGANWTTINSGLTNDTVISIAITASGTIFALTNSGLFRSVQSTTSIKDLSTGAPISFSLNQNYPNPFNPTTKINFQIPIAGIVSLKVYDVLGKEVTALVDEEKPAGSYEINFNAVNLPSGVYLYKLQAGSLLETKKMILMK